VRVSKIAEREALSDIDAGIVFPDARWRDVPLISNAPRPARLTHYRSHRFVFLHV